MQVQKDYSTLVREITERAKFEARMHADEYLQVSKQSLEIEKIELRQKYEDI